MKIKSGVYKITCLENGKKYIGSSMNIERRFSEHLRLLRKGGHYNASLQADFDYYGEEAFVFEFIFTTTSFRHTLTDLEQMAMRLSIPVKLYNEIPASALDKSHKDYAVIRQKIIEALKVGLYKPYHIPPYDS